MQLKKEIIQLKKEITHFENCYEGNTLGVMKEHIWGTRIR